MNRHPAISGLRNLNCRVLIRHCQPEHKKESIAEKSWGKASRAISSLSDRFWSQHADKTLPVLEENHHP
jgi:hypothetical protein